MLTECLIHATKLHVARSQTTKSARLRCQYASHNFSTDMTMLFERTCLLKLPADLVVSIVTPQHTVPCVLIFTIYSIILTIWRAVMPRSTDTRLCSGQSMLCKLRISKIDISACWHDESLLIAQHRLLSVLIIASSHDDCDKACQICVICLSSTSTD